MEASQRGAARHGLPGAAAGPAPGGAHRVAVGTTDGLQPGGPVQPGKMESGRGRTRHDSPGGPAQRAPTAGVSAGAPHLGGALFNSLLHQYHPLGCLQPVGEHLKYSVYARGRLIACLAWSSAPRHLGARDRFIGWTAEARRRNLRFLAYNPRFLIVPWILVTHLASHILGQMARRIAGDWERTYGHPIYFLETFVDPERHRGTCYRAANWVLMGRTTGRGKNCPHKRPNRSIKEVLGYPLTPRFRELLAEG